MIILRNLPIIYYISFVLLEEKIVIKNWKKEILTVPSVLEKLAHSTNMITAPTVA